jgi:hypothetical protein
MITLSLGDIDLLRGLIAIFPVIFAEAEGASCEKSGRKTSHSDYR